VQLTSADKLLARIMWNFDWTSYQSSLEIFC
jgi:hypothetical protein